MAPEPFNILERLICGYLADMADNRCPRLLVRRQPLLPSEFRAWSQGVQDQPNFPISRLAAASNEISDWKHWFKLHPLANRVERDVLELDSSEYSESNPNTNSQVLFSFSVPVRIDDASFFFGKADKGFLAAQAFVCRYEGEFTVPTGYDLLRLWAS